MDSVAAFVQQRAMRRIAFVLLSAFAVLLLFGLAGAVRDPEVARYTVPIIGLKAPLRIVQLSDSHANYFNMPPARVRRVVQQINALHPDLVVLTGDFAGSLLVEWPAMRLERALDPLGAIRAPLGVYAVLGNHDIPFWTQRVLARTPVKLLVSDWADAGPIILAGAESMAIAPDATGKLRRATERAPTGKPLIAISHEPDFFQSLPARAQLLIAGHTHGGQIILPFFGTRSISPFIDRHLRGLYREHGQTLVVSSGLGTSVIPIRIGVPPEIVEINLIPAATTLSASYSAGRKSGTER